MSAIMALENSSIYSKKSHLLPYTTSSQASRVYIFTEIDPGPSNQFADALAKNTAIFGHTRLDQTRRMARSCSPYNRIKNMEKKNQTTCHSIFTKSRPLPW